MSSNPNNPAPKKRRGACNQPQNILFIAQFGILLALEVVCFTPLGSLRVIGPIVATLSHIPVIITAVVPARRRGH